MDPRKTSAESMSVEDFASGFIAETEASMRGKLSELRLPTLDESPSTSKGPMNQGQGERPRILFQQPVRPLLQPMIVSHRHIFPQPNQNRVQYAVPGLTPVRVSVASSQPLRVRPPIPNNVTVRELIFNAANTTATTTSSNPMRYHGVPSVPANTTSYVPFTHKSGGTVFVRPSEASTPTAPIITIPRPGIPASTSAPNIPTHPPVIAIPPRAPPFRVKLSGSAPVRQPGFVRGPVQVRPAGQVPVHPAGPVPVRPARLVNTVFTNRLVNIGPPSSQGYPLGIHMAQPMAVPLARLPSTPTITNIVVPQENKTAAENSDQTGSSLTASSTNPDQSVDAKSDKDKDLNDNDAEELDNSSSTTTEENTKTQDKDAENVDKDDNDGVTSVETLPNETQEHEDSCNIEKESDKNVTDGMKETNDVLPSESSNTITDDDGMAESEKDGNIDAPLDNIGASNSKKETEVALENKDAVNSDIVVENKDNNEGNLTANETDEQSEMCIIENEKGNEVSVDSAVAISVTTSKDIVKDVDVNSRSLTANVEMFSDNTKGTQNIDDGSISDLIEKDNIGDNGDKDGKLDNVMIDESNAEGSAVVTEGKEIRAETIIDDEGTCTGNNEENLETENVTMVAESDSIESTTDQNVSDNSSKISVDETRCEDGKPKGDMDLPRCDDEAMLKGTLPNLEVTNVIESCKGNTSEVKEMDNKASDSMDNDRDMNIIDSKGTSESNPVINTPDTMKKQTSLGLEKQIETPGSEEQMNIKESRKQKESQDSDQQMDTHEVESQMDTQESEPMDVTLESAKQDVTETRQQVDASESETQVAVLDLERSSETPKADKVVDVPESDKLVVSPKNKNQTGTSEPEKTDHTLVPERTETALESEKDDNASGHVKVDNALEQVKTANALVLEKTDISLEPENKDNVLEEEKTDSMLELEREDNALEQEKTGVASESEKTNTASEPEKKDNTLELEKTDYVPGKEKPDKALEPEKTDVSEEKNIDNALEQGKTDNASKPEKSDVAPEPRMIENIIEPETQIDDPETEDADLYYEITENKDSDEEEGEEEESGTNLIISNVVSLSESLPEENSPTDVHPVEKETIPADTIPETITDQEKGKSIDVNSSQKPGPSNVEDVVGDNAVEQKRRRKRKRESTAVRKAMDCIEQNTLEGMFIPVTTVLKTKDKVPGKSSAKETTKSKQSAASLPVISSVFTMAVPKASDPKTVPLAPIKHEAADTGEYNAAIGKVGRPAPRTSVATVRPVHIGKKVTAPISAASPQTMVMSRVGSISGPPISAASPQTMVMSRVGSISGPQVQVMRYALHPSNIALSKVSAVPVAPSTAASTISSQKQSSLLSSSSTVSDPYSKYDTINMTSVGVGLITDLIARKNPIPTYKAAAVSEKNRNEKSSTFPCYECGDTFHLKKSLDIHLGRRSMKIAYKCRNCASELKFTNKCQLLNHLRSHMNILITQAVPIHIRSDSIEITSYYEELMNTNGKFEWYNYDEREHLSQCPVCKEHFNPKDFKIHLNGSQKKESLITCNSCWVQVPSRCAFQAHRKIHKILELFQAKELLNQGTSILEDLICPNCGITPEDGASLWIKINKFMHHLLYKCHHFSMSSTVRCVKCGEKETSNTNMMLHLIKKLEHYYKCDQCPMALKSLSNLESHCQTKHSKQNKVLAKVIYRCHVCSTIIDDRQYLLLHLDSHLSTFIRTRSSAVHCLVCGLISPKQQKLEEHAKQHRFMESVKDLDVFRECVFCRKKIQSPIRLVAHLMEAHISMQENASSAVQECFNKVKFCDYCGLLCADHQAYVNHYCLGQLKKWHVVGNDIVEDKECPVCGIELKNSYHKTVHMNSHLRNSNCMCVHCGKQDFENENAYKSHKILCSAMKGKIRQVKVAKNEETDDGNTITGQDSKENDSKTGGTKTWQSSQENESKTDRKTSEAMDADSEITLAPPKNRSKPVTQTTVYKCDKCMETFTRKSRLDAHVNSEHGLHPCHLCGEIHSSSSSLKRHLLIEHEGKRMVYVCTICRSRKIEKSFSLASKLAKHMRLKHRVKNVDESQFVQELPGFPGMASKELSPEAHTSPESSLEPVVKKMKIESDPTSAFKCAKCLFTCEEKAEFTGHILEHKTPNSFQCPECGLCFSVFPSLKKHLFMVHKIRDFARYIEENGIENPADSIDSDDDIEREPQRTDATDDSATEEDDRNPLECKVCYKLFDSEKVLKCHMRVHGMAFIKRSRRMSKGLTPNKKAKLEQEEERQCEVLDEGNNSLKLKIVKSKRTGDESVSSSPEKPSKSTEKESKMEEENIGEENIGKEDIAEEEIEEEKEVETDSDKTEQSLTPTS